MITTLLSHWIICCTLMSKNSSAAIKFVLYLCFFGKTETKYKNSQEISYYHGIFVLFWCFVFLVTEISLGLKMLKLDLQPNFTLSP